MDSNGLKVEISLAALVKVVVVCIGVYVLYLLLDFIFLLLFSVILASAIRPAHIFLSRFKIPRVLSVILVYLTFVIFISIMLYSMIPIIQTQGAAFYETIPNIVEKVNVYSHGTVFEGVVNEITLSIENSDFLAIGQNISKFIYSGIGSFFGGFVNTLLIAILTFLFAVEDKSFNIFLKHITPRKYENYVFDLWERSVKKIGAWFQGQLLLGLIVGSLAFIGLYFLGVPNALFLALFAAIFELVPVVGPIISAIPAFLIAISETTLYTSFLVIVLFILIQQLENQIILPLVISKLVGIPTVIVIVSLVIGATLGGLLGLVISIPITAVILEFIKDLETGKINKFVKQYEKESEEKKIADA